MMVGRKIHELVRGVISAGSNGRGMGIRDIEHHVYLERMGLPEGDPVRDGLPYYLDLNGFSSSVVRRIVEEMADTGDLVKRGSTYHIGGGNGRQGTAGLLAQTEYTGTDIMRRMFSCHPLSKFLIAYRFNFMKRFERYCNDALKTGKQRGLSETLDSFESALLEVPRDEEFFDFRCRFNNFSRALHILLGTDPRHDECMPERFKLAIYAHKKIWEALVAGARLHQYDPYYRGRADGWQKEYKYAMVDLEESIKDLRASIKDLPIPKTKTTKDVEEDLERARSEIRSSKGTTINKVLKSRAVQAWDAQNGQYNIIKSPRI